MEFEELKAYYNRLKKDGKRIFTTCSFQSHSLVLLHMLSRIDSKIHVFFINTGYLFPQSLIFKEEVTKLFGLEHVYSLKSDTPKYMQKDINDRLLFTSNPDYCCYLNKTQPMDKILNNYDIWINGVRADQSSTRAAMKPIQPAANGCMRLHPMLDWDTKKIKAYQLLYQLPEHPLEKYGYQSIGCEPCTRKLPSGTSDRDVRWFGLNKTECGLHTDLIDKK